MGIFDRISMVLRSNINDLISKAEDPEKMLNQIMEDMERDHMEIKTAVAQSIATEKQLGAKYKENQDQADGWSKKAELAVSKGDDNLAREALNRKAIFAQTADGFKKQWDAQKANVDGLKSKLGQLESKINEAQIKKDLLIARNRQATAEEAISKTLGKMDAAQSMNAFDRMEEKVMAKEASAAAYTELSTDTLEDKFRKLETTASPVDDELAALKAKLSAH